MTYQEKTDIIALREKGLTYWRIGERLGLSVNTVKSFCRRTDEKKNLCKNCGKPLSEVARRSTKTFCCDWCRRAWWKTHRDQTGQIPRHARCKNCGHGFLIYGKAGRKYCSHRCYIADRFGGTGEGVP
ncbi:hypothetical protein FACS1894191_6430 [Clostridia bacterium]|nr:hypothetical protein FACS1894191_6430 [Clostridia bacterium]